LISGATRLTPEAMPFVRIPGNPEPDGAEELWFEGQGGVRLRAMLAPAHGPVRGSILLCPGRTEFIEKYFEVTRDLTARGFIVLCVDWRGQGLSAREAPNPLKGHMESLDDAGADLAAALRLYESRLARPYIVLAHSMGGAIALRALQTGRIQADAAVFSAPMWGIPQLSNIVRGYLRFMKSVGLGKAYAPGVTTRWAQEDFSENTVTHHKGRHERSQNLIATEPQLALAGPTNAWVAAAAEAIHGFGKLDALAQLRLPVLVATAGDEQFVDNASHARVVAALPDATHINLPGARHEIMMETDETQKPFWEAFDRLVDRVAPRKAA
jgi:lysophospholipase